MSEVLNPVDVERQIMDTANEICRGVSLGSERHDRKVTTDREYDAQLAQAFLDYEGPQTEKKYAAELATQNEREARDVADVAYRYAEKKMRALELKLSALQTVAKSVNGMYQTAGRGER